MLHFLSSRILLPQCTAVRKPSPALCSTKQPSDLEKGLLAASISCGPDIIWKHAGCLLFGKWKPSQLCIIIFIIFHKYLPILLDLGRGFVRIWNESCQRNSTESFPPTNVPIISKQQYYLKFRVTEGWVSFSWRSHYHRYLTPSPFTNFLITLQKPQVLQRLGDATWNRTSKK